MDAPCIRSFRPGDEPAIADVIKSVFDEYGFTWEPEGYNRDSFEIAKYYLDDGGGFWVMERDGKIIGTVGIKKRSNDLCELYRLYLRSEFRGLGLGKALYEFAQQSAQQMGFKKMEMWSDKKLLSAHEMYRKSGAESLGDRICDDPDNSLEWGFMVSLESQTSAL